MATPKMVEAGGIEPPSEDLPTMATTRLVRDLELALKPPTNRLPESTADLNFGATPNR